MNDSPRRAKGQPLLRGVQRAGVLYAPDDVINAGGIISVAHEYRGDLPWARVKPEIDKIPARLMEIFERACREGRPASAVADEMARERLARGPRRMAA